MPPPNRKVIHSNEPFSSLDEIAEGPPSLKVGVVLASVDGRRSLFQGIGPFCTVPIPATIAVDHRFRHGRKRSHDERCYMGGVDIRKEQIYFAFAGLTLMYG